MTNFGITDQMFFDTEEDTQGEENFLNFENYNTYFTLVNAQQEIRKRGNKKVILKLNGLNLNLNKDTFNMISNGMKQCAPAVKSTKRYEVPLFKMWLFDTLRTYFDLTDLDWLDVLLFNKVRMRQKTQDIQFFDQIIMEGFNYYFDKNTFDNTPIGRCNLLGFSVLYDINKD